MGKRLLSLFLLLSILTVSHAQKTNYSTIPHLWYDYETSDKMNVYGNPLNVNNDEWIDQYTCQKQSVLYEISSADDYQNVGGTSWDVVEESFRVDFLLNALDYNNDGLTDFLSTVSYKNPGLGYTRNYKGEYVPERLTIYTPEEWAGVVERDNLYKSDGLGSGLSIVGGGGSARDYDTWQAIDINADGLPDYVRDYNGGSLVSSADGHFIINNTDEVSQYRDFNGDGLMDNVTFYRKEAAAKLNMLNKDGSVTTKTLFTGVQIRGNIWCYDFDRDGDVDILIPVDYMVRWDSDDKNNGMSLVVLVENQDGGSFKVRDYGVDGEVYFTQCMDIDADGHYELIAGISGSPNQVVCYKVKDGKIQDNPIQLQENLDFYFDRSYSYTVPKVSDDAEILVADISFTGVPELICRARDVYYYNKYRALPISIARENTPPHQPQAPSYAYDAAKGLLKVYWTRSSDAECSAADLSYALRIGTGEGMGDMFYAHARQDGTRRNLMDGNCGFATMRTIDVSSWPAGDYHIAVQAVDPGHRGSEFSSSVVFHKEEPAAGFILSHDKETFGVGDTLRVVLSAAKEEGCSYKWDMEDAVILRQTDVDADMLVRFASGGKKNISLQVVSPSGKASRVVVKNMEVAPASLRQTNNGSLSVAMDIDGDGRTEIFLDGVFKEGDEEGNYEAVKKLWNNSLSSVTKGGPYIIDWNKDGLPDLYFPLYGRNNYMLTNNSDMQMSLDDLGINEDDFWSQSFFDIDNDGALEGFKNGKIYKIKDNVYSKWELCQENAHTGVVCDYNKDGLIDFYYSSVSGSYNTTIFLNNGDYTFDEYTMMFGAERSPVSINLADIDGDGSIDKVLNYGNSSMNSTFSHDSIRIEWGDGTAMSIKGPGNYPLYYVTDIYDIDNNGCLDLLVYVDNKSQPYAIYYFRPDRSYTIANIDASLWNSIEYTGTNGDKIIGRFALSAGENQRPAAPTDLRSMQTDKAVVIEWSHSVDKETPAALMRYNISIKRKGMAGEWSYLLSPLNMDNDEIELPSPIQLLETNRITIPLGSIPAGDYEVKVQGVDRWHAQSKFSETYQFTVLEQSMIDMPTHAWLNWPITMRVIGNSTVEPDFDKDAEVTKTGQGTYSVRWTSPGMKTVTIGNLAQQNIYVEDNPKGDFSLPTEVMCGANVVLHGDNLMQGVWQVSNDGGNSFDFVNESDDVAFGEGGDNEERTIKFSKKGTYLIWHTTGDNDYGYTYSHEVVVNENEVTISFVDIDEKSGCYRVAWDMPEDIAAFVESVIVYKETSRAGQYAVLDTVPAPANSYVDLTSTPDKNSARYQIAYLLNYGISQMSMPHQPLHVMINHGMAGGFNLMWSKYEGVDVESYRILGGTSADNLQEVDLVSGNLSSYTTEANSRLTYYAVEVVRAATRAESSALALRSNIVSTNEAQHILSASEIVILPATGSTTIDGETDNTLQLLAYVYPIEATLRQVDWFITSGSDIATINKNGLLTATGDGTITVRAQSVDGSNVYGEIEIKITGLPSAIEAVPYKPVTSPRVKGTYTLDGLPVNKIQKGHIYIIDGRKVKF